MRKAETPQSIFKRFQGATSPNAPSESSSKIMENITFLNRNCKFLSYVEKEKLVTLIKAQDVEVESLISQMRDNDITKDEMKSSFYAFLYPKQAPKKSSETSNPNQRAQQSNYQRSFATDTRFKRNAPVTAVRLELGANEADKEGKSSLKPSSVKGSEAEYPNYSASGAGKVTKGLSSQEAQERLQKLTQRSQGGYFDTPANVRDKSIEGGRGIYNTDKKNQNQNAGKLPVTSLRGLGTPGSSTKSPNYSARGHSSNAGRSGEKVGQSLPLQGGNIGLSTIQSGYGVSDFEGTSPDFLLSLGIKPGRDVMSPPGSSSQRGSTSSITQQGKLENPNIRVFNGRDQTFATQASLVNRVESAAQDSRGKSGGQDRQRARIEETGIQISDYDSGYYGKQKGPYQGEFGTSKTPAGTSSKKPLWQQEKSSEKQEDFQGKRRKVEEEGMEGKYYSTPKVGGAGRKGGQDRTDVKLSGVSEKTKEVLNSLLGGLGNGELLQNLMKKLEDKKVITNEELPLEKERHEDLPVEEEKRDKEGNRGIVLTAAVTIPDPSSIKKIVKKREKRPGSRLEEIPEARPAGGRRGVSLGGEREHPVGMRSEKYVSVNMIKRVLDNNLIYIEDIMDEIFRHLGDNIVNKNYFAQVIGNYLSCLPEQNGLQTQDIVNKMFDICDRNGDGLISYNDLGSGAALFSQIKPTLSKERRLYKLLDPQNRGFIIETDIVSVLTKANTLANSSGRKLYSGPEEIVQVARSLLKELDKEKKGVISYWDIFLWKDTKGFSELVSKLETYTNSLDELSSAKKSISSPPHNKQGFMSNNRSPVQNSGAPFYSSYSPGMNNNQENTSFKFTLTAEASKSLGPSLYAGTTRTDNLVANTPAPAMNNQPSSYLYTQQSPTGQGILQNLSAFDSLSKEIRIEDMLQSVNSGTFGNKVYVTDLTISSDSKAYTPIKDPLAPGTEAKSYTIKESSSDQMRIKNFGLTPAPEEVKAADQGQVDLMNQDIYSRGPTGQSVDYKGGILGAGTQVSLTTPRMYETSYVYSSDTKGYGQSPGTDFKSYMDLPYKSVEIDTKRSDGAPNWRDYLANLKTKEDAAITINQVGAGDFKPYSPTSNVIGGTSGGGIIQENKMAGSNLGSKDLVRSKNESQDYVNFTLGNNVQTNYALDNTGITFNKKKEGEKISIQDFADKQDQSYGQKSGLQESMYSGDTKSYLQYPENQSYGLVSNTKENDLKNSVEAYGVEGQGLKASGADYGQSPDQKNYLSADYKSGNFEARLYESGSYPYSSSLKQSGYQSGKEEGMQAERGLSSPGQDIRGSGNGSDWYGNYESKNLYGYYPGTTQIGQGGTGKMWNQENML